MLSKNKKGFTLVELVLTIIVIGIISIPLSIMISRHIESVFISEDYNIALNLSRLEMETVNNMNYLNINSANYSNYRGYNYDLTRTVRILATSGNEGIKEVLVQVLRPRTANVLVSLKTYITRNLEYGT